MEGGTAAPAALAVDANAGEGEGETVGKDLSA